jgi:hypothetical protein
MSSLSKEMPSRLRPLFTVIPPNYVKAISVLHEKLGDIKWAIGGDLAECFRTVQVVPDGIELICSKQDAERIHQAVAGFKPTTVALHTKNLSRNAVINGKEYPIYIRSHQFGFKLHGITVSVQGNLQFRVGEWEWGDPLDFSPEYVNVVGKKTAVMPLGIAAQMYQTLGWADRVEKIRRVIRKPSH